MAQSEYVPRVYSLDESKTPPSDASVSLRVTDPPNATTFTFEALRPQIFRVTFNSTDHPLPPYGSVAALRLDLQGLIPEVNSSPFRKEIILGNVKAAVTWMESPVVSLYLGGNDKPIYEDLPFRSYAIDGTGIAHYTRYFKDTLHVGLGEKAAPMDLSGRSFTLSATDAFGYNVYRTDPLYKNIPLLINATPEGCVATFSASHSQGSFSIGSEMDGLWGPYKVYRQSHGGLEQYLVIGRTLEDVVRSYADLVGYPLLVPKWAFGYLAGGMKYSMLNDPPAYTALIEFAKKLKEHDIPCSGFQLSSGYTVAESEPKTRNVFTWNKHRFPDPKGFIQAYREMGIRIIANIKPYVLANHPEYENLSKAGALFYDPRTQKTAVARLWSAGGGESGVGSHIDFTSSAGFRWWFEGVKKLREIGIEVMWNDNNEYTIPDDGWQCALSAEFLTTPIASGESRRYNHVGLWGRSVHTELMAKASHDALVELEPGCRPFVLTRSATAGTMRFAASSWSGDNVTSWESLKGSLALSLGAGMCLLQCYGHDIGGFEGPQPTPELLLRWVQLGVYSSRFAINCFKTSSKDNNIGDVIEPWMYPAITGHIRKALKRRYELIPYLYSLSLESHLYARPPQRWVGWGYEHDPEVWTKDLLSGEGEFWLGNGLLVGSVFEPGTTVARIYLPRSKTLDEGPAECPSDEYYNLNPPHQYLASGQWVEIDTPWQSSIPVLAKVGSAIPVGKSVQTLMPGETSNPAGLDLDDDRGVEIYPPRGPSHGHIYRTQWYEDDGISAKADITCFEFAYSTSETEVLISFSVVSGAHFVPPWKKLRIILPVREERTVMSMDSQGSAVGSNSIESVEHDEKGRRAFKILCPLGED